MDKVPVVWFDGSDLDATAYAIADNRTHEFAEWDEPALAKLLDELRSEDSLDGVGYTADDIDELLAELEEVNTDTAENPIDDPGADEPPDNPTARPGDLWLLGEHRLLCGDSTNRDDVARVIWEVDWESKARRERAYPPPQPNDEVGVRLRRSAAAVRPAAA